MGTRSRAFVVGLLSGAAVAAGAILLYESATGRPANPDAGQRDRLWRLHEAATKTFLSVPKGKVHLRGVPSRGEFMMGNVAVPGTVDTADDATHEFFRDETSGWFVHLVEIAVPEPGTVELSIVDRPAADGTPKSTLGAVRRRVVPGQAVLVGFGMDNAGRALEYVNGRSGVPTATPLGAPARVRLLVAGGHGLGAETETARTRLYSSTLTPSVWGPVSLLDVNLDRSAESETSALTPTWVAGPDLPFRGHVESVASTPGVLGVLAWMPREGSQRSHGSWVDGKIHDEHAAGDVSVTRTNAAITVAVRGKPVSFDAFPYPAWVARVVFVPDAR